MAAASPIQPYFVLNTTAYYKRSMHGMGISHFYEFVCDSEDGPDTVVVPDGTIDVIFCCDPDAPDAIAYGSVANAQSQMFVTGKRYFGVRFLPGVVLHFGDVSAKEILSSGIPLPELQGMRKAVEQIAAAADFISRIDIFSRMIFPLIGVNLAYTDQYHALTGQILAGINRSHGMITVRELEQELFYSQRHLNRVFQEHTGFSIKKFCRFVRFQHLLGLLKENATFTVLEASEEAGYYDQNHMQKEFHEFAHTTPKTFRELLREEHYPDRIITK